MNKGYLSFAILVLALIAAVTFAVRFAFQSEWIWAAGCGLVGILLGRFILLGIYHEETGEAPFFRKHRLKNYHDFRPEEKPDSLRDARYGVQSETSTPPDRDDNYIGDWKDGVYHGHGTYTYANGDKYVGEFEDGKEHGQGTYTYADGSKGVGEWKDGKQHGQGTWIHPDGAKYVGEFKNDEYHGQGAFTWASGSKYVGAYKDGKHHGQGTGTWPGGSKYVGDWKDGVYHGEGTFTHGKDEFEGDQYAGEYKDGKHHGQGTYTWADGTKYVGEWKDNKAWQGTQYNKDGNVTFTYSEGVEESVN